MCAKERELNTQAADLSAEVYHVSKSFGEKKVLADVCMSLERGKIYCLMGPSGQGKTTFLRLLCGLEQPDDGEIIWHYDGGMPKISGVFQEDRLCENADAVTNVAMVCRRRDAVAYAREQLLKVLPPDSLDKQTAQLSGGMKRRVSIVRAMAVPSDFVFMDEPFTGLDEETRGRVVEYILKMQQRRTLLIVTHQASDAALLNAEIIYSDSHCMAP